MLVCLLAVLPARADEVTVSADLVDSTVDAGQPAEYHIEVANGRCDEAPPAPSIDGLSITYAGPSQSTQTTGGFGGGFHTTSTFTYIYSVETNRPGRFVIPGQEVRVGRQTFSVPPVTLNVMGTGGAAGNTPGDRPARQAYFAELVIPRKSAFVGESIPIEFRVYFGRDVTARIDPNPILSGDGFSVQKFTAPQQSVAEVEGEQFRLVTYKAALTGVKTGSISVGPAETSPVVQVPRAPSRRRRPSGDPFEQFFSDPFSALNQMQAKQVTLRSDPVTIEIKPLPPGKPADFSGAIGQFKLAAEADPRKAATGDPVTLHLSLRGQGNFDRILAPVLADEAGLRTYPANAKFKADDDIGLSGLKTFDQVVIADSARTSLPGYHLSYFDPATERYQTLQTPPLAVAITGASTAPANTTAAAPAAGSTPTPAATPTPTPRAAEDILYIRGDFGPPRGAAAFLPLYRRIGFWEMQAGVLLLVAGGGAVWRWRRYSRHEAIRRAAELQRQRASLDRTLRQEGTGRRDFYSAARRLAQLKAATTSSRPGADLTPGEIRDAKRLPPEVAGSVEEIFHRHDELTYSGRAAAQEPIPAAERRAVLATLETLGKN